MIIWKLYKTPQDLEYADRVRKSATNLRSGVQKLLHTTCASLPVEILKQVNLLVAAIDNWEANDAQAQSEYAEEIRVILLAEAKRVEDAEALYKRLQLAKDSLKPRRHAKKFKAIKPPHWWPKPKKRRKHD